MEDASSEAARCVQGEAFGARFGSCGRGGDCGDGEVVERSIRNGMERGIVMMMRKGELGLRRGFMAAWQHA